MSVLCQFYFSYMAALGQFYVSSMSVKGQFYVSPMSVLCQLYVRGYMPHASPPSEENLAGLSSGSRCAEPAGGIAQRQVPVETDQFADHHAQWRVALTGRLVVWC